jgi:Domain of unknown function (DUF4399)
MYIRKIAAIVVMTVIGTWSADAASTNDGRSPGGPQFTNLKDGDAVSNPVIVRFTSAGATMRDNMGHTATTMPLGHLHLIIDAPVPAAGQMVPMDSRHIHLLHGETQATLHLLPGDHTLQLVLAGADHHVGNPPITSAKIIIHVVSATGAAK